MWLLLVALLALLLIRLIYLVLSTYKNKRNNVKLEKAKTLIVLGSGGNFILLVQGIVNNLHHFYSRSHDRDVGIN